MKLILVSFSRHEYFIHIKELPWLAYQREIRDFFHGLSVQEDGIMIRQNNAFVAFGKRSDIDVAMNRDNRTLVGSEVQLTVISRCELRRILFRLAKRKLDFSETDGVFKKPRVQSACTQRKKIRPTPVLRGKKRKVESSMIFCPKETDLPPPEHDNNKKAFSWAFYRKFSPCKRKKIHPVRLSDNADVENFSTFHPVKCYELTSMIEAV